MELLSKMIWLFLVATLANFARVTGNSTSTILSPSASILQLPASSSITKITDDYTATVSASPAVAATPTHTSVPMASATSTPAPTKPVSIKPIPSDAKQFKGEVAITDEFKEKLADKNSQEFKDLADKMTKAMEDVYKSIIGFLKIIIDAFKPGSTVIEFRVIFQSNATVTEEEAAKLIKDEVTDGKLGGLSVVENSIKVTQVGVPTKEPPTTATDSMQRIMFVLMLAGVIVVGLVLILLTVVVILLAKLWPRRNARKHESPMY